MSENLPPAPTISTIDSEVSLCLSCGFCCNSVLHWFTQVIPDEVITLRELGFDIKKVGDLDVFHQPCPKYKDNKCSIYPSHPYTCKKYACKLLDNQKSQNVSVEESHNIVNTAQTLLKEVTMCLPSGWTFDFLRKSRYEAVLFKTGPFATKEAADEYAELFKHYLIFCDYLMEHFIIPSE